MPETIEATSPATAKTGDANGQGSGNLTMGQAALQLLARAEKVAEQKPAREAAETVAPATATETTPEKPAAEATAEVAVSTETPAAVETTETPATVEGETDPVLSKTISFNEEQQSVLNRRIGKEVAKTAALKAESDAKIAALQAELQKRATPEPVTTAAPVMVLGNVPLAEHNDIASLMQLQQTAKEAVRYVEDVLDDPSQWKTLTIPDPQTGEERQVKIHTIGKESYTETDLKRQKRKAQVTLEDQIPARAQFLNARQAAVQQAYAKLPWLNDKSSPDYQRAQAARRDPRYAPVFNSLPDGEWMLGLLVEGLKTVEAREAAAKAAAETTPAKPKVAPAKPANDQTVVSSSAAPARQTANGSERQALAAERARLSKKGAVTAEEAKAHLKSIERLRNSR